MNHQLKAMAIKENTRTNKNIQKVTENKNVIHTEKKTKNSA